MKLILSLMLVAMLFVPQVRLFRIIPSGTTDLLDATADFTYEGMYTVAAQGLDSGSCQGLTHRTVSADLRFLSTCLISSSGGHAGIMEFSLSGKSLGDTVTAWSNEWDDPWGFPVSCPGCLYWHSLKYDESDAKLYTNWQYDYDNAPTSGNLYSMTLNSNGTVSNIHGPIGLQGLSNKQFVGALVRVPASFASTYSLPERFLWGGGYMSLAGQYTNVSAGGFGVFIPDIAGYTNSTDIPSTDYKIGIDHTNHGTGGSAQVDWFNEASPLTSLLWDRSQRISTRRYFGEGNDIRNGNTGPFLCVEGTASTSGTAVSFSVIQTCTNHTAWTFAGTANSASYLLNFPVTIDGSPYTITAIVDATNITINTSAGTLTNKAFLADDQRPLDSVNPTPDGIQCTQDHPCWAGLAPDSYTRQGWRDTQFNGYWYNGTYKSGWLTIVTANCGDVWYANAFIASDSNCYERHVYNPLDFVAVVNSSMQAYMVQPSSMKDTTADYSGISQTQNEDGEASIDCVEVSSKCYVFVGTGDSTMALLQYAVNDNAQPIPISLLALVIFSGILLFPRKLKI